MPTGWAKWSFLLLWASRPAAASPPPGPQCDVSEEAATPLSVDASEDVCILPLPPLPSPAAVDAQAPTFSSAFNPALPLVGDDPAPLLGSGALPELEQAPQSESEAAPEPPPVFAPLGPVAGLTLPSPHWIGSQIVVHWSRQPRNGELMVVALYSALDCNGPMLLRWQNRTFRSFAVRDGWRHALLPIGVTTHPGHYPLRVRCGPAEVALKVAVQAALYPESKLQVAPRFSQAPPPRVQQEAKVIAHMFDQPHRARQWQQNFVFPTAGVTTSPYGVRRTFNGKLKSRHLGEDFRGAVGDPVWATNDAVVALAAQDFYFTGNALFLDHGEGLFSMYFHLSQVTVRTGDHVRRGQTLGAVGGSGRVTGPHMHFGIRLDGTYIDPSDLLGYDPSSPLGPPPL